MNRAVGVFLEAGTEAWAEALDQVVIALMIEKKSAVEDLDSILDVPGVDMVQFGPSDYSNSLGHTGQPKHPEVREAEKYVIEKALSKGIAPRIELGDAAGFEPYLEMGVKHFNIGIDVRILYSWFATNGGKMRRELGLESLADQAESSTKSGYGK